MPGGPLTVWLARSVTKELDIYSDEAFEIFGGEKSTTGILVNRRKALQYAAAFRAVNMISRDVAKLPLHMYRRVKDAKERAPEHPLYPILRYKPNREMTAIVFWQTLTAHAILSGNGYANIARRGSGQPEELIPLNPEKTYPVRVNGVLWYVTEVDGKQMKLPAVDVFHLRGLSFDGLVGYSVLEQARDSLGLGLAIEEYGSRFFSNDASPGILIEHPAKLSKDAEKNLIESWNKMHQGLEKQHRTAVLEEGMKAHAITISARDSQLIESRTFEIRQIANWFGVPPHKLGDPNRTSYNSLEQENQSYLDDALDGWLCAIEAECRDKLLTEKEKVADEIVIEFLREALLRADITARTNAYRIATGRPWLAPNEVRARENLPRIDDPEMDKVGTQSSPDSGQPAPEPPPEPEPEKPPEELVAAQRAVLLDGVGRMVVRIGVHARKAARKPETFLNWLETMGRQHYDVIAMAVFPGVNLQCVATGRDPQRDAEMLVEKICSHIREKLTAVYDTATKADFAAAIDAVMKRMESELPSTLEGEYHGQAS